MLWHPEKRRLEVVVAKVIVFRAIVESRSRTHNLSYGYEPSLCLSDAWEIVLQIPAINLCCGVEVSVWYKNTGAERREEQ